MEDLFGSTLQGEGGAQVPVSSLNNADCVAIYFSAHWCPPCRGFTPQLAQIYSNLKAAGKRFEVVFASSDRDQAGFDSYFGSMPWLAIPFSDRQKKEQLSQLFGVNGIPMLVLLDKTGRVISKDGRSVVTQDPYGGWIPDSGAPAAAAPVNPFSDEPDSPIHVGNCAGITHELQGDEVPFAAALATLRQNPPAVCEMAQKTMIKLLTNIVKNPDNENFRQIHMTNKAIQDRVMKAAGAKEFLMAAGFVEIDSMLLLLEDDIVRLPEAIASIQPSAPRQAPSNISQAPPAPAPSNEDPKRAKYLAELKAKKSAQEAEKAALRARIANQREEQKHHQIRDSRAVLLKGRTQGTSQSASDMGLDGGQDGGG